MHARTRSCLRGVVDRASDQRSVNGNPFGAFLEAQGFLIVDGGLARALEDEGHSLETELWSARLLIDEPAAIRDAHLAYLEAGADCITTASYQASFEGFRSIGRDAREAEHLMRTSTHLAVEARDMFWSSERPGSNRLRPIVAASVGPYGAYLADGSEYDGRYGVSADRLRDFHLRRFEVLAATEADIIACETIPSALEAEVLLRILGDVPDVWAWFSFSCQDATRLNDGSVLAEAVGACSELDRVAGVGVNCTAPGFVHGLVEVARDACDLPLIAYPNSGESYDAETKCWSGDVSSADWIAGTDRWVDAGARVLGGCCRVGPNIIRDVRTRVANRFAPPHAPPHP